MHPLVDEHTAPLQLGTRSAVFETTYTYPPRESWYTTTKRWFGVHHHPCGVSNDVEISSFEHDETDAAPSEQDSSSLSICESDPSESLDNPLNANKGEVPPVPNRTQNRPSHRIPALRQYADVDAAVHHRTKNRLKHPREDDEYDTDSTHDTSQHSPSWYSRSTSPTTDTSLEPSVDPCYPKAVYVRGGRAVHMSHMDTGKESPVNELPYLCPPPSRLRSMASLTSFTIDSARALDAVDDLAAASMRSSARVEERATPLAPVPWASSRCSLEVLSPTPQRAPKLRPAFFPSTPTRSEISSPTASPLSSRTVQHSPLPTFQRGSSDTPASPEPPALIAPPWPSLPPLPKLEKLPPWRSAGACFIFPLTYMGITSEQMQACMSWPGAWLPSPFFYYCGVPLYHAPPQPSNDGKPQSREERSAKKRRRHRRSTASQSATHMKPVGGEAATSNQECILSHGAQSPQEPMSELADSPHSARSVKMQCRWPGCTFSDDPGKLWAHIKDAHGNEGFQHFNALDPQQDVISVTSSSPQDAPAPVSPPQMQPAVASMPDLPLQETTSSSSSSSTEQRGQRRRKSPSDGQSHFKRPITCHSPTSTQSPQPSVPPRPKVWAMGFTDNTVQDGWFVNTTGTSDGLPQQGAQRKRRRTVQDASEVVLNKKSTRPPPMPLEQSPLYRQCLWIKNDGSLCLHGGTADEVWAHMRTEHGMDKFAVTEAPRIIECGWPGCTEKGTPDDLIKRCETKHKEEAKASVKAQHKDLKSTPAQCRICDAWVRVDGIGRHVDERHWKSNKRTRFCDICGRRERHEKFFSQHHFLFCLDGFMQARPEFRTLR